MAIERILLVDDDGNVRALLSELLRERGLQVLGVPDLRRASEALERESWDLLLCDVRLPDGSGLEFAQKVKEQTPTLTVMLMTGYGDVDTVVQALRLGVSDFLIKPVDDAALGGALERVQKLLKLQAENKYLREEMSAGAARAIYWGKHPTMLKMKNLLQRLAPTDATVLIQGESGTGKEVAARVVHEWSTRHDKPFIKVNCAAVPENLLESEFFGHEKGAFTGATARRLGRFELAHEGTLLLDEISEIPPSLQVKLLRVLQEREFERVGGNKTIRVDVRVIATTNRNLAAEVREKRFREDLFYRLNVLPVELPPLRERGPDVVDLAKHFVESFSRKHGKKLRGLTPAAEDLILSYSWPGNVRELQNMMERAVILAADSDWISPTDLALPDRAPSEQVKVSETLCTLAEMEMVMIHRALEATGGNRTQAARILGITDRTLRNKLAHASAMPKPISA